MYNLNKKHWYLIGTWFVISLLQAVFTGLHSDESYYWMYSQNLAWGYFDHPPMIAFLIRPGYLLFSGEAGVRLFIVLLSTATFALIVNELNEKKDIPFLILFILSFPLIHTHIAGFLAIPDVPLLFFTLCFLILYRKFLEKPSLIISALLAVSTAAMIYSKYHAFLVIGFTVFSNLKLMRNKYFWLTVAFTIILLVPHAWWQFDNEFPTFKYHLVDRAKPFRMKHIVNNLLSQYAMAGPLTGVLVFWALARFKIKSDFDRALIFNILGFYIVLFLVSFNNRIEAHWSAAAIPMLMFAIYPIIKGDSKVKLWFKRLAVPTVVLIFLFRLYLALDVIPNVGHSKIAFYNRNVHAQEIKELANGKKVGFFNNYAAISNYIFYSGDSAVLLSTPDYRFNQFDLWDEEKYAEGEPVFAIKSKDLNPPNLGIMATGQYRGYLIIEKFQSLKEIEIEIVKAEKTGDFYQFEVKLQNNSSRTVSMAHVSKPVLAVMQNKIELRSTPLAGVSGNPALNPGDTLLLNINIPIRKVDTKYPLVFYTRTKEKYRGEVASLQMRKFASQVGANL
jgi:hypothetical protein